MAVGRVSTVDPDPLHRSDTVERRNLGSLSRPLVPADSLARESCCSTFDLRCAPQRHVHPAAIIRLGGRLSAPSVF